MTSNVQSLQLKARGFYTSILCVHEDGTLSVMYYNMTIHYWKLCRCWFSEFIGLFPAWFYCLICVLSFASKEMKYPHRQYR